MNTSASKLAVALVGASIVALMSGCAPAVTVVGTWGDAAVSTEPSLELSKSGKLTGTDGCNRLVGEYEASGNTITFKQVASTMMFCEQIDTWLSRLDSATVSGDTMTVFDANSQEIGTLDRTE